MPNQCSPDTPCQGRRGKRPKEACRACTYAVRIYHMQAQARRPSTNAPDHMAEWRRELAIRQQAKPTDPISRGYIQEGQIADMAAAVGGGGPIKVRVVEVRAHSQVVVQPIGPGARGPQIVEASRISSRRRLPAWATKKSLTHRATFTSMLQRGLLTGTGVEDSACAKQEGILLRRWAHDAPEGQARSTVQLPAAIRPHLPELWSLNLTGVKALSGDHNASGSHDILAFLACLFHAAANRMMGCREMAAYCPLHPCHDSRAVTSHIWAKEQWTSDEAVRVSSHARAALMAHRRVAWPIFIEGDSMTVGHCYLLVRNPPKATQLLTAPVNQWISASPRTATPLPHTQAHLVEAPRKHDQPSLTCSMKGGTMSYARAKSLSCPHPSTGI